MNKTVMAPGQAGDGPSAENSGQEGAASDSSRISPVSARDHYRGELGAPVEIIVYNDYTCSFCAGLAENLDRLREEYPDEILVAARHFPLRVNTGSYEAALALECAAEQGKFWELHGAVYAGIRQGTSTAGLAERLGRELADDPAAFSACLAEEKYASRIQAGLDEAGSFGVIGTPGLFINGNSYAGALPLGDFVDSQGERREGLNSIIKRILGNE